MRIEAVQNERRPYTNKHELLSNGKIQKHNENHVKFY